MARPADVQRTVALTVVARSRLFTDLLWQCWQCWPLLHDGLLLHLQYSFLQQQGRPSASGYCQVQRIWVLIISCSLLLWGCGFVFLTPELTLNIYIGFSGDFLLLIGQYSLQPLHDIFCAMFFLVSRW